jgi:outer membrane protein assembly factor BamB
LCAAGRNFYNGSVAREAFNGLRLWHREAVNPLAASDQYLFVATKDGFTALDAVTGQIARRYEGRGWSAGAIHDAGTVIVYDHVGSVRAYAVETAKLLWEFRAARPRGVLAADGLVAFVHGEPRGGGKNELVVLDKSTGQVRWKRADLPWLPKVANVVYHRGLLACEVSTLSDDGAGNSVQLVSAADGKLLFGHAYDPGMGHQKQARPMFLGDRFWILHVGPGGTKLQPVAQISALDAASGKILQTFAAEMNHCYPPVATPRYLFSGWLDVTDLESGALTSCHVTKSGCGPVQGCVPANGLLYTRPNHCGCWPMLRGYAAFAPQRQEGDVALSKLGPADFVVERTSDPPDGSSAGDDDSWPSYRHDAWRSGSTPAAGPAELKTLWSASLGGGPARGPITDDWRENPFVRGAVTGPVIAGGLVYVARPDAHEVLAMDACDGRLRWKFVAGGRVDTPPTIHRGLCLFGSRAGWVYCLRADDGRLVWRLRAAARDERIVAHGQIESPWPVPGSVLLVDGTAYFAAGRHALADGGILVFAVEPASGKIRWVKCMDTSPSNLDGLDYECFDLLFREGDGVAMSRWVFDRANGALSVKLHDGFARLDTGKAAAMVPRGCWSYAPKEVERRGPDTLGQSLVVFRDNVLLGSALNKRTLYRRDFNLEGGEKFDPRWPIRYEIQWPGEILAAKAAWQVTVFEKSDRQTIAAMVLAGDKAYLAGSDGELQVRSAADGKLLAATKLGEPVWDGMAVAAGRLFVSTRDGQVACLGREPTVAAHGGQGGQPAAPPPSP